MDAKIVCLGVLTLGEATGYEIRKMVVEGPFAMFHQIGFGSIYPSLARLEAQGAIEVREVRSPGRPMRRICCITDEGRRLFREALQQVPSPDLVRSDTLFLLFFADWLGDHRSADMGEAYLQRQKAALAHVTALDDTGIGEGRRFVRGLARAIYGASVDYLEKNLPRLAALSTGDEAAVPLQGPRRVS